MGKFGKVITFLLLGALAVMANALAMKYLWGWFVVPLFGAPFLTMWQAYGLAMVAAAILPRNPTTETSKPESSWEAALGSAIGTALGAPAALLLVGWIVKGLAF
jgi:hypothetical protein